MTLNHAEFNFPKSKMVKSPAYAVPLVVRYQTLIALTSEEMELAVKYSARQSLPEKRSTTELQDLERPNSTDTPLVDRNSALNNLLFKLRHWADKLSHESSKKVIPGPDVLEALEASNAEVINKLHWIFSGIANKLGEKTSNWEFWFQSLNKSLLLELDHLVWPLRDEYEKYLDKSRFTPSRPSLVLCLDGGGVRSYSTLLILRTLMYKVEDVIGRKNFRKDPLSQRPARPRDFFDYIFGTSSGGMIAVMLGRLQMTVDECITSFREFGDGTFARPRTLHNYNFLLLGRSKYGEGTIHKTIQRVVDDFVPGDEKAGKGQQHTFAALDDKCKTGVWACASRSLGSQPCLFRTYNHEIPANQRPYLRSPGLADSCLVWSVARATMAAPYLFDEAVIEGKRFVDGGLIINNPSLESYFEVDCLHQERLQHKNAQVDARIVSKKQSNPSVAVLVSIGSGLRPLPKSRSKVCLPGIDRVTGLIDRLVWATWTSTERAHEQMERETWQTETAYHRFNVDNGIGSVRVDEWKKRGDTNKTLEFIENMTRQYINKIEVDKQLQKCAEQLVELRRKQL